MALIDLQNITKQYDIKVILKDVNFTLKPGQRTAVIGQNGQGKSTLFKIITKQIEPDSGEVSIDKSIKIEILDQQPVFKANSTVKDIIQESLVDIHAAREKYEILTKKLETQYEDEEILEEHSEICAYLDHHNAWDIENKLQKIIQEFDLVQYQDKDINLLSGGEQRRVSLACLILKKPDILLLDEPTNHLDVYMVEFLEELLVKEKFTLLFISHDRYFMDTIATNIVEISDGQLRKFKGGYNDYLIQKQQLMENMQKEQHNLVKTLKAEAKWMQTGVAARRKRNERRKKEYLDLKQTIKTNPAAINKMSIELQREQKSFNKKENQEIINKKKMLFEIRNISKSFGGKQLIKNFSARILQKDTIAIVGPNGCGKSTILKILMGNMDIDSGNIKKGDFKIGYFDQQRGMLNDDDTIMDTFCPNGGDRVTLNNGETMHVFGYLKNFLFPKEYLTKKISVLSGGEKNRIALSLLFTKKVDLLILDEPTNDLDILTINILEDYLRSFQGALIFVSHDRYFVDKIAKKLFIYTGDGNLMESFQPYRDYLETEKDIKELEKIEKNLNHEANSANKSEKIKVEPKPKTNTNTKKKLSYKEQRLYEILPDEIDELEKKLDDLNIKAYDETKRGDISLIEITKYIANITKIYEEKVAQYLELEELVDSFAYIN